MSEDEFDGIFNSHKKEQWLLDYSQMTPIEKCHTDFKVWVCENNHTGYKLMKMGYFKYAEIRKECIAYLISRGHSNVCIARVLGMHRNNVVPSKIRRKEK